jgi:tyrosine-protein phosphatase SIW14
MLRAFLLCCLSLSIPLNASGPGVPDENPSRITDKTWAEPSAEIPGVYNFARVSEALWRGSQPTAEGFRMLEKLGVKTIISCRNDADDLSLLKGTKLKYLHLPSERLLPKEEDLVTFLKVVEDPKNWPVFIHCAEGQGRTGYHSAIYRMVCQGWSMRDAILEMNAFHFQQVTVDNPGFLARLDIEFLKKEVKARSKPEFLSFAW